MHSRSQQSSATAPAQPTMLRSVSFRRLCPANCIRPNHVRSSGSGESFGHIHAYTRLHREPTAETDMQEYFCVSPPSVHQMVLTLERGGVIRRQPRNPRSIEVLVDPRYLPELP